MTSQHKRFYRSLILIFVVFSLGIGTAGYFFYDRQKTSMKQEKWDQISAIASLKVKQIVSWRKERLGDGAILLESPFIADHLQQFLEEPRTTEVRGEIIEWMGSFQKHYYYRRIFFLDPKGTVRLSIPKGTERVESYEKKLALEAMQKREVILSDLYRDEPTGLIRLCLLVPVSVSRENNALPMGVLLLRMDPNQFLYPLLQVWPTPSRSSECVLVRREGEDVVVLNELVHRKDAPLNLRFSTGKPIPSAMAALGKEGIVEGVDYRGIPVLAAMRSITDSPWFLVSKVDQKEIYAPIRVRTGLIGALVSILIIGAAFSVILLWRGYHAEFERRQYEAELQRRILAEHVDYLTRYANDIILLMDENLRIVEANERAVEAYGYTRDELLRLTLKDLRAPDSRPVLDRQMKKVKDQNGFVFESFHQCKDGTIFPVENSSRVIEVDQKKFYQSIIRDIAGRKQAEEEIKTLKQQIEFILGAAKTGLDIIDSNFNLVYIDPEWQKVYGDPAGKKCYEYFMGRSEVCPGCGIIDALRTKKPVVSEEILVKENNRSIQVTTIPFQNEKGEWLVAEVNVDISERKRAEETLNEMKERYRTLVEESFDGIFVQKGPQIVFANRRLNEMLGYNEGEIEGMEHWLVYHPEYQDLTRERAQARMRGEKVPSQYEVKLLRKDGSSFDGEVSARKIMFDNEPGIQVWVRDITERKRSEEALRKGEETSRQMAHENEIMAEIGRIISSTLNIEEVYERFAEEVRKLLCFDRISINIINLRDRTLTFAFLSGIDISDVRQGDAVSLTNTATEETVRTRAGLIVQTEDENEIAARYPRLLANFRAGIRSIMTVPLIYKNDVIGVFQLQSTKSNAYKERDLRLAERVGSQIAGAMANALIFAEREQAVEALRRSEEKFKELYNSAPVGYHEYDVEGRITQVNKTELEMLGYTAEEMLGCYVWEFIGEGEISRQTVMDKLSGKIPPGKVFERTYRKKDGTTFPVLIEDRLIRNTEERIVGIRSTLQDITELKRTEGILRQTEEQLRQSQRMEAIGRLAGGIAHDFNNLLTIIKGYSEFSFEELEEGHPLRENIQEIQKATERAANLTQQILAFSRRQLMEMRILDLNTLLKDLEKMLRRIIGEDIELVTTSSEGLGTVKADSGQIQQVIMNLAVNARDAMPSGGKLTIETANVELDEAYALEHIAVIPGRYVMLSVSDTGVGMTPEVRERAFEPFFTTKEKGKGIGLGLSTVYGIVKQSGGNIWVYSEPGQGTTFKIYLPRMDEPSEDRTETVMVEGLPRGDETILVVEDEEVVRKLIVRILSRQGYSLLEASEGNDALKICEMQKGPIHLVMTDVVLPGMSGRQVADRLISLCPGVKVLYMSGYTDNAIASHGVLEEGVNYMQKPFTVEGLVRKVREVLDK